MHWGRQLNHLLSLRIEKGEHMIRIYIHIAIPGGKCSLWVSLGHKQTVGIGTWIEVSSDKAWRSWRVVSTFQHCICEHIPGTLMVLQGQNWLRRKAFTTDKSKARGAVGKTTRKYKLDKDGKDTRYSYHRTKKNLEDKKWPHDVMKQVRQQGLRATLHKSSHLKFV